MTLIRTPFRKKRRTVAGDETITQSRRSKSQTPQTVRSSLKQSRFLSASSVNSESNTCDVSSTNTASNDNFYADINSSFEFDFNIRSLFNDYDDYVDEHTEVNALETIEINECKHLQEQVEHDESVTIKIPMAMEKMSKIHLSYIPKIFSFADNLENTPGVKSSKEHVSKFKNSRRKIFFPFFKKKAPNNSKSLDLSDDNVNSENDFILCRRCRKQIISSAKDTHSNVCNCEKPTAPNDDGIYVKNSTYKDVSQQLYYLA